MNNLVNFERIDFSDVRFHEYDGKLWFFGEDIAKALKYPVAVMDIEELVDAGDFDGLCKRAAQKIEIQFQSPD